MRAPHVRHPSMRHQKGGGAETARQSSATYLRFRAPGDGVTADGLPRHSRHIEDAALVAGWPALFLSRLLEDYLSDAAGHYDRVRQLRQVAEDLRRAGQGSAVGTPEQAGAELVPSSRHDQHDIGADEAAAILGCSAGYARRLAREERLAARRGPGGAWRFDLADVEAEANYRQEGAA